MIRVIAIDYMYCVCIMVVRKIFWEKNRIPLATRISRYNIELISIALEGMELGLILYHVIWLESLVV
jgi:hypothetical protein